MIWYSLEAMTIADILIVGGVCFAICNFIRTHGGRKGESPNWGLLMVLFGFTLIAGYYFINFSGMYILPLLVTESQAWSVMRGLHLQGYWAIIGLGLLFLIFGLHLLNRDMRALAAQLKAMRSKSEESVISFPTGGHAPKPQISQNTKPRPIAEKNRASVA